MATCSSQLLRWNTNGCRNPHSHIEHFQGECTHSIIAVLLSDAPGFDVTEFLIEEAPVDEEEEESSGESSRTSSSAVVSSDAIPDRSCAHAA